ncbi:MAG TPA: hypothetical protein PKJ43_06850 [Prolixibacteraceae bacterium]|nr:hypothetical protein [Prolixibacteraceae bacterium]
MQRYTIGIILLFLCKFGYSQTDSIVPQLPRPAAAWESGYQQRINLMWGTRIPLYNPNPSNGNADSGKSEWSKLLAKMAWPVTNSSAKPLNHLSLPVAIW